MVGSTANANRVIPHLYRSLLKIGRNYDKNPAAKAIMYRTFNLSQTSDPTRHAVTRYYSDIFNSVFHSKESLFVTPDMVSDDRSFVGKIKQEFRSEISCGDEMDVRIDTAFAIVRKLSSLWTSFEGIMKGNTEEVELHPFDIQPTNEIFPGMLLIAHPLLPGTFHRSVILVLEHNESGSYGIVINKHTLSTVEEGVKNLNDSFLKVFGSNQLHTGGRERRFQVIHSNPSVDGVPVPISDPKLFSGGSMKKIVQQSENGPADTNQYHFYAGCCWWNTNDLQKEIQSGYWIPVQGKPNEILAYGWEQARLEYERELADDFEDELEISELDESEHLASKISEDQAIEDVTSETSSEATVVADDESDKRNLWYQLLNQLGKSYSVFAKIPTWSDIYSIESVDWK